MHRLFVPGPLKTQRNFDQLDSADDLGQETGDAINAATYPAAFMLQKSADFRRLKNKPKQFQILTERSTKADGSGHAAALLQQRDIAPAHEKGRPALAGRPKFKNAGTAQVFIDSKNSELFLVLRS
jgi:hypothetical protein